MNFRGDSAEQRRPSSDNLVDLHISVVPMEHWVERLNYASHQIIGETFSAGFLRVFPDTLVSSIRGEIKNQLGTDILPKEYVFLKHVGRCLALVRQKQETELKVKNFLPPHSIMPEIFVLPGKPTMYTYSVLPPIKPNNTINNEDINSKSELQQSQKYIDSLSASYNNTPQPVQENVKKNAIPLPKSAHKSPAKSQVPNLQRKTDIKRQKRHVSGKSSYENEQKTNSTEKVTNMRRGPTSPGQVSDEFGGMTAKEQMVVVAHQSQQQFDDQNPNLAKSTLHDGPKKRRVRYNMPDINQSNASSQEFDDYNMHDNHLVANGYEPDPKSIPFNSNQDPYNNKAWQEYDNPQNSHENPILMRSQIQPSDPQTKDHLDNFRDNFDPLNDPKFMENVDLPADLQNFDLKGRENFHPLGDSESSSVRPEFMTPSNPKGNFPTVKPNSMNEDSGYVDNSDSDEFTNQGYERIDPRTKISREKNSQINQQQNDRIGIRNQPSATNVDSNPSPSPIRIPQFNKPAVERHNNTPSPVIPKTPKKTTENRVSKEVTKGTARITTVSQKGENGVRLGSPDRSKLWSNLQRIRSERRTSEKQRQDLVRQAKVTTSKMNQKRTSVRDMWKKKFFEEKKKATPLEETCKRLQVELDTTHQRLVSAMEGGAPRVAMPPQKFPAFLPHIGNAPSLKNNSKIQVTRLQHNMDNLRRRIEDAKIKLTGEIKLRHQAEQQVKSVRQELLAKKIQCHLAYREVVRGHAFQPTIRSKA